MKIESDKREKLFLSRKQGEAATVCKCACCIYLIEELSELFD